MTNTFSITLALLGLGIAFLILVLVRRDHLHLGHASFWVVTAGIAALLGIWPGIVDIIAGSLGIFYPPTLFLLLTVIVLLIKALLTDLENTRLERRLRRLNQKLALLEVSQPGVLGTKFFEENQGAQHIAETGNYTESR